MIENNNNNSDISVTLAKKIAEGTANREERGLSLKMINTQLAIEYVTGLDDVKAFIERLKEVRKKMSDKFVKKIEEQMEADEIPPEIMFQYLMSINNKEIQLVSEYRKLLQGNRQLFDEDTMSEDDKVIMRLLRSFRSIDQKRDFLKIATEYMQDKHTQDADIVE